MQTIRLEPRLKLYTITTDEQGNATAGASQTAGAAQPGAAKANTGKVVVTSNVQDLGEEEIAGHKARHYMISMRMQSSGCAGDADHSTKMEIWTSDIPDAVPCNNAGPDYSAMMGTARPACKMSFEQKGDVAALAKAYRGLIMRMKMYNGDKVTMTQEVTMVSRAKLTDDPFAVPADYKQVSEQEFQQAQSRAMMEAMMEQAKAGAGNEGDNNGEENTDKAPSADAKDDEGNTNEGNADEAEPKPAEKPKKRPKLPFKLPF
jgi:hypothetical protein